MTAVMPSNARIEFRLPLELKREIEQAAIVQHRSLSEFAISVLTQEARRIIAEQTEHQNIVLSQRDAERFMAMLDADPTPNAALQRAAKRHRGRFIRVPAEE